MFRPVGYPIVFRRCTDSATALASILADAVSWAPSVNNIWWRQMSERVEPLDDLSGWELPPPSARDAKPVRVFETAAAATAFLKMLREHAQRARPKAA